MHSHEFSPAEMRKHFSYSMATKVVDPLYRFGKKPYERCQFCGKFFTAMGITRHVNRCVIVTRHVNRCMVVTLSNRRK